VKTDNLAHRRLAIALALGFWAVSATQSAAQRPLAGQSATPGDNAHLEELLSRELGPELCGTPPSQADILHQELRAFADLGPGAFALVREKLKGRPGPNRDRLFVILVTAGRSGLQELRSVLQTGTSGDQLLALRTMLTDVGRVVELQEPVLSLVRTGAVIPPGPEGRALPLAAIQFLLLSQQFHRCELSPIRGTFQRLAMGGVADIAPAIGTLVAREPFILDGMRQPITNGDEAAIAVAEAAGVPLDKIKREVVGGMTSGQPWGRARCVKYVLRDPGHPSDLIPILRTLAKDKFPPAQLYAHWTLLRLDPDYRSVVGNSVSQKFVTGPFFADYRSLDGEVALMLSEVGGTSAARAIRSIHDRSSWAKPDALRAMAQFRDGTAPFVDIFAEVVQRPALYGSVAKSLACLGALRAGARETARQKAAQNSKLRPELERLFDILRGCPDLVCSDLNELPACVNAAGFVERLSRCRTLGKTRGVPVTR
jgi:hypothetical protein